MKQNFCLLYFLFVFFSTLESQSICNKKIVVWNFHIDNDNTRLANQIAKEVGDAINDTEKSIVLEREKFHEVIGALQNEQNLCFCPNDLVEATIKQLKNNTANEVVFGKIEKDEYNDFFVLQLTFVNLNNLRQDKTEKIYFNPSEFNNSRLRDEKIKSEIANLFECDKIVEEYEILLEEIRIAEQELVEINNNLNEEYKKRLQLDEHLLLDRRIKKDYPNLQRIHEAIVNLNSKEKETEKKIEDDKIKRDRLSLEIQKLKLKETENNKSEFSKNIPSQYGVANKDLEEKSDYVIVTSPGGVFVKSEPDLGSKRITSFPKGKTLKLTNKKSKNKSMIEIAGEKITDYWYEVVISKTRTGWVFGGCIKNQ